MLALRVFELALLFLPGSVVTLLNTVNCLQEIWEVAKAADWKLSAVWEKLFYIFNTFISTKEALEDPFGELAFVAKSLHKDIQRIAPERLFLHTVAANRWNREEWPWVLPQQGDMSTTSFIKHKNGRQVYIPPKRSKSTVSEKLVDHFRAGLHAKHRCKFGMSC